MQNAAREMVELAETGYETRRKKQTFDTAWQEMLNHATIKVRMFISRFTPHMLHIHAYYSRASECW